MLKAVKDFWDAMFKVPTITDDAVQRSHKASAEVRQCEALIQKATFQKHMALHELIALESWNHGHVLKNMPSLDFPPTQSIGHVSYQS